MPKPKTMPTPWLTFWQATGHTGWWTETGKLTGYGIQVCDEVLKFYFDLPNTAKRIRFVGSTRSHEKHTVHVVMSDHDGMMVIDEVPEPFLSGTVEFAELHVPDYPHWWLEWE